MFLIVYFLSFGGIKIGRKFIENLDTSYCTIISAYNDRGFPPEGNRAPFVYPGLWRSPQFPHFWHLVGSMRNKVGNICLSQIIPKGNFV